MNQHPNQTDGIVIDQLSLTSPIPVKPHVTSTRWLSLFFNTLLVCYSTALIVQVLTFVPLTLPTLAQLPKVAAVIIIGVGVWLHWLRRSGTSHGQLPALTLAFAIGLLVGL